ncbi:MAG: LLM class flavin-dependent oxidoreductase [Pseudonocardiales bacterium]|nr:LLM class flavin-dependent oxidoreductase [Actinomycetota bacterium]
MRQAPFRFGIMAPAQGDIDAWLSGARRAEALGYSTLLSADRPDAVEPLTALATVAAATSLRVATFVLSAPLRPARSAAWQGHSLSLLTGGRFDFGIGAGLPRHEQSAREFGLPFGSPRERLAAVGEAIDRLRELDEGRVDASGAVRYTPVLVAAGGPRSRALAAAKADIVTLGFPPLASRDEVAELVADVARHEADRADGIELAMNIFVVGQAVPSWVEGFIGATAAQLVAADSLVMLRGNVDQMCDELQRRRERFGASYIVVNSTFAEQFAPVVQRLTGR